MLVVVVLVGLIVVLFSRDIVHLRLPLGAVLAPMSLLSAIAALVTIDLLSYNVSCSRACSRRERSTWLTSASSSARSCNGTSSATGSSVLALLLVAA